jgi:hypothetical protein
VAKFAESHSSLVRQFLNQLVFLRHVTRLHANSHQTFNDASNSTVEKERLLLQSRLRSIFQRIFYTAESFRLQNNELIHLERSHITPAINNRTLIDRIARLSRRLEERVAQATTLVMRRQPAIEIAPATTPTQQTFETAVGRPWQQNTASAATIGISQITDEVVRQLDRRVVATRERLGRI